MAALQSWRGTLSSSHCCNPLILDIRMGRKKARKKFLLAVAPLPVKLPWDARSGKRPACCSHTQHGVYSEPSLWRATRPKVGAPVPMHGTPRCTDKAGPDKAAAGSWLEQIRLGLGRRNLEDSWIQRGNPWHCTAKAWERGGQGTAVTWSHQDEVEVRQKHSRKGDKLDEAGDAGGREHRTPAVCQHDAEVLDFAWRRQNTNGRTGAGIAGGKPQTKEATKEGSALVLKVWEVAAEEDVHEHHCPWQALIPSAYCLQQYSKPRVSLYEKFSHHLTHPNMCDQLHLKGLNITISQASGVLVSSESSQTKK